MASLEQIFTALRNADAAGDVEGARALAAEIVKLGRAPVDRLPGQPTMPEVDAAVRGAANGLTFGMADRLAAGGQALTGGAPSYADALKSETEKTQAAKRDFPVSSFVGELGGGVAGGAGLVRSGATFAGRVGPGFLPRTLGYGAEGGAYGAAHGAGNTYTGNPGDYVNNAVSGAAMGAPIGAGLGVAAPIVGAASGAGYRGASAFFGPRVEDMGRGASSMLRGAAMADEPGLRNLGALGPSAMLPDAGPAMLGLAQGAGTGTGPGRSRLVDALTNRDNNTGSRLARTLDDNLGPSPIPSRVEAHLSGDRAYVAQEYEPLLQNARAVNTQALANNLEVSAINLRGPAQQAVQRVRAMLDIPGNPGNLDPHPRALLSTRQAIDGLLAGEVNPHVVRELTMARHAVDAELARAVPGVKAVDAQIEELARQSTGLQRGGQLLDSGKTAIRPQELTDEMAAAGQPHGQMVGPSAAPFRMRQGARAEVDRIVGTNLHDLPALERTFKTPEDWNYQKLGTVFGGGQRDSIAGELAANRRFRDTYHSVVQGSQTAQRSAAAKSMDGPDGGNIPLNTTLVGAGANAVNWIAKSLVGASNDAARDQVGRFLANSNPSDVQRLARALLDSAQTTNRRATSVGGLARSPGWLGGTAPVDHR